MEGTAGAGRLARAPAHASRPAPPGGLSVLGTATDPDGRRVELTEKSWRHIVDPDDGHPDVEPYRDDVLRAVGKPDRRLPGRRENEEWFYLADVGPSRWLKAVVAYEGERGRIVTAFARRSFP